MNLSRPMKAFIGIITVASLVALFIGAVSIYSTTGIAAGKPIAEVNGDPITAAEFNRVIDLQRASVIDYFKRTYGADFGKDFWHTDYNGEMPADTARKWALEEVVKIKIQLNLAKAHGIIQETSYKDLLTEMEKENERRRVALQGGEPVYGPTQFDESTFVDYYLSRLLIELKKRLSEEVLISTEDQLRQHYEKIKDSLFRLEDNVRFYRISVSYMEDGQRGGSDKQQKALEIINEVKQRLEQGKAAHETVKELKDVNAALDIQISEEIFNNKTSRMYFKSQPELYAMLTELEADRISPAIDYHAEGQYVLARIIGREPNGYKSFEEQKSNIRADYINVLFDAYLKKQLDEAEVNLVEDFNEINFQNK